MSNKIIHNQVLITSFSFIIVLFVIITSSCAIFNYKNKTELNDMSTRTHIVYDANGGIDYAVKTLVANKNIIISS